MFFVTSYPKSTSRAEQLPGQKPSQYNAFRCAQAGKERARLFYGVYPPFVL